MIVSSRLQAVNPPAAVLLCQNPSIKYNCPELEKAYTSADKGEDSILSSFKIDCPKVYVEAIHNLNPSFSILAHNDPVMFLLPVLEIHVTILYGQLCHEDYFIKRAKSKCVVGTFSMETCWDALRMLRHDGMRPLDCFRSYDVNHNNGRTIQRPEYATLFERFQQTMTQIERTEELARDYLQIEVGRLSLQESRASIKQSKIAQEESRRTNLGKCYKTTPRPATYATISNSTGGVLRPNKPRDFDLRYEPSRTQRRGTTCLGLYRHYMFNLHSNNFSVGVHVPGSQVQFTPN